MKKIVFVVLLLLAFKGYSQHNVYTFNNGTFIAEDKVKQHFNEVKKTLPAAYELSAVIYHKAIKNDTIVNYITFAASQRSTVQPSAAFAFQFKQDSTFLLLDKKLPAFVLKDMDGKRVSSESLLGKPTLINFWAIYCGPCIAEMPELSKLKKRYKDKVNFLSITENSTTADNLHEFLKNKDFNFRVLDGGESYKKKLKIAALPRNLFVDKDGILRHIQVNYPIDEKAKAIAIDDKNNYFTKIIDELIANSK